MSRAHGKRLASPRVPIFPFLIYYLYFEALEAYFENFAQVVAGLEAPGVSPLAFVPEDSVAVATAPAALAVLPEASSPFCPSYFRRSVRSS